VEYQRVAVFDEPVIDDALFEALTNVEFNTTIPASFSLIFDIDGNSRCRGKLIVIGQLSK
jgi:hypothetical protein